jgi:hypothetical protein
MFNTKMPRGSNCFICHEAKVTGLTGLPSGNHIVLAPYATGARDSLPQGDVGTPLGNRPVRWEAGLDAKWTPNANTAIDATINPDFSQVESDVAQITANQRFALFYPEKRPFFLEGLELFSTPIQAVYTRTITSPRWGARVTGVVDGALYTALVAEDRGGGSVVLPGPNSSDLIPQDFSSRVAFGRARKDFGTSFGSFLLTDREIEGGGHNRVLGPDFQWRPNADNTITGQFLYSDSQTPDRPDLTPSWNGQSLSSHADYVEWNHSTRTWDWDLQHQDLGDEFRADLGFVPQVGIHSTNVSLGRSFFVEQGPFRRIHPFFKVTDTEGTDGGLLLRRLDPGIELQGLWNGYMSYEHRTDRVRAGNRLFDAGYSVINVQASPSQRIGDVALAVTSGDDVDFANQRPARSLIVDLQGTVRPTDHLSLQINGDRRWLDVSPTGGGTRNARLFTADLARVKATYTFTSRAALRLIAQRVRTRRDLTLFDPALGLAGREEDVTGSALFSYKINWQTVLFLGYSDDRSLAADDQQLSPAGHTIFFKISYAFQR